MTMNSDSVIKGFDVFKNQVVCVSVILHVKTVKPFPFSATSIENKSTIEYETEQGLPALIYGKQGVSSLPK